MTLRTISRFPTIACCIAASAVAMVGGHWLILNSEAGKDFTLRGTWVSKFAAAPDFGWVIKLAIGLFCLALLGLFSAVIQRDRSHPSGMLLKFLWQLVATLMIGGLVMIALYDIHDPGFWTRQWNWVKDLFGSSNAGEDEGLHHSIGFALFVSGFCIAAVSNGSLEWRAGQRARLATTAYLLVITVALLSWLLVMRTQDSLVGIPQRALLVVVAIWVLRTARYVARSPKRSARQPATSS